MCSYSIVLVRPQLEENIGAAARVMANFNLSDLRIVNPSCSWMGKKAKSVACNASHLLDSASVFSTVEESIGDLRFVYALSARKRHVEIPMSSLPDITLPNNLNIGFMFGPEQSGLSNDDLSLVDMLITIDNQGLYKSLNLAQAVAVVCYEITRLKETSIQVKKVTATKQEISGFYEHLQQELHSKNFFRTPEKITTAMLNIKHMFKKHEFTSNEIKTLRGIIKTLSKN